MRSMDDRKRWGVNALLLAQHLLRLPPLLSRLWRIRELVELMWQPGESTG